MALRMAKYYLGSDFGGIDYMQRQFWMLPFANLEEQVRSRVMILYIKNKDLFFSFGSHLFMHLYVNYTGA
jgi:hypothetical protein